MTKDLKDWWAVVKAAARSIYEVTQCSSEVVDDNVDVEDFLQENEMPICSNTPDANKNDEAISLVTQGEMEEVGDLDVGNAYMEVRIMARDNYNRGMGKGWGRVRNGNRGIVEASNASNYDDGNRSGGRGRGRSGNIGIGGSSNISKRGKGEGRSGNIGICGSSNISRLGNHNANYDDGSRSAGRGKSRNIGIGGSNVSELDNHNAEYDDGSRSAGKGMGRSGNIGIGGSSNVSKLCNHNADYDDGSKSASRGRSGNISICGSSNVSGLGNHNAEYDDGSRSAGRGRGRSGNIGIGGSSNVSRLGNHERGRIGNIGIGGSNNVSVFGDQDANYDYDNGSISRGGVEVGIYAVVVVVAHLDAIIRMQIIKMGPILMLMIMMQRHHNMYVV
uniref:Uncharacterized protein n=1 Tax=Tanacetum cinerariifolium TaxID=118510 RepID=A0A699I903_TANCI|nr:hypothetical protein [Tanacetum cinerariifolium]